jgi:pimeloyl-ACP methyl ester carboxylesterase
MFNQVMKRLSVVVAVVLCLQLGLYTSVESAGDSPAGVKELNFVFIHGGGGTACTQQLLADTILEYIPAYILEYEQANPGVKVNVNILNRCYPGDVDVDTWAHDIADSIDKHLPGKEKIILIGHSMGGKAALYAVAKNVGNLADRTALVVTIDSPIKPLERYSITGGGSFLAYCRAALRQSDRGMCTSAASYDSSDDGKWVGQNRHWLALIAGENAPLSKQFDFGGVDAFPRDMDDGAIPISAQYSDGADVVYYGEYGHSDFGVLPKVADFIAKEILRYIFGGTIQCSVFARGGSFGHKANWRPGTDYWRDLVGDVLGMRGRLWHWNESYTSWQEWEDVMEYYPPTHENDKRSRYQVSLVRSPRLFTGIEELRWLEADNPEDCRVYLRTKAAPRGYIQVDWSVYRQGLLPVGTERDRYEVGIVEGTPLAGIGRVVWASDDPRDLRLEILSHAESPFRWFEAEWRVFQREVRQRKIIDEILTLPEAASVR